MLGGDDLGSTRIPDVEILPHTASDFLESMRAGIGIAYLVRDDREEG